MKKLTLIIIILFSTSCIVGTANAQTTPKPTTSESANERLNSQINQLKDKIASRVTELNLVEKRGVIGEITETATNKITLKDIKGNTKTIDIDEITKFSSGTSKTFGLSDLTKGTKVRVLGLYNKQTKRLLARFITTSTDPVFLTGGLSAMDVRNQTADVLSANQKTTKIDIGTTTRIFSYGADGELTRITFSRLVTGDRITIIGYPDRTDASLIVADRIIVLAAASKDPKVNIEQPPTTAPTAIPTTPVRRR